MYGINDRYNFQFIERLKNAGLDSVKYLSYNIVWFQTILRGEHNAG